MMPEPHLLAVNYEMVLFAILGAAIGSFLNVGIDRLPHGGSLLSPASHCPACQQQLGIRDLVPVFSYLWLRGRCRYCGVAIPQRLLWVEVAGAALFAFLYWQYSLTWEFAATAVFCCFFLVLLVIDLERGIVPNKIVYPGMALALPIAALVGPGLVNAAIGGGAGFGLLLLPAVFYRGGMGWGDVKLAGLIGLVTGFPLVFVALWLAIVGGGLTAGALLLLRIKRRREAIPFAPFLSAAAMATLFWGSDLLGWFLQLA